MIVADAGSLIGLARVGHLKILEHLYGQVVVPQAVFAELKVSADRPGSREVRAAHEKKWLIVREADGMPDALLGLDAGETDAIRLAEHLDVRILIDEWRGRVVARRRGLTVIGTGGVLLAAKIQGHVESVGVVVEALHQEGYRLSEPLRARLAELSGEA